MVPNAGYACGCLMMTKKEKEEKKLKEMRRRAKENGRERTV